MPRYSFGTVAGHFRTLGRDQMTTLKTDPIGVVHIIEALLMAEETYRNYAEDCRHPVAESHFLARAMQYKATRLGLSKAPMQAHPASRSI